MSRANRVAVRGFVQGELLALVIVTIVLAAMMTLASSHARRQSRTAGSVSNLQKFASGITSFGADNDDGIVSLTWRAGPSRRDRTGYIFPAALTDVAAAANQAVATIRWYGGRTDITAIPNWIPHISYNHLALAEHLEEALPADFMAAPNDPHRLAWQRASRNTPPGDEGNAYFQLLNRPQGNSNNDKRWPYSSSYQFVPASYSPDARTLVSGGPSIPTIAPDPTGHNFFTVNNSTPLGRRRLSEIAFPANKVLVFETHSGDMGANRYYFAYDQVKAPMLFGDGSVSVRSMSEANPGFQPNLPFSPNPTRINYIPSPAWEPPTPSGAQSEFLNGRVMFTRSGLRGRDFGGPEVPWVD